MAHSPDFPATLESRDSLVVEFTDSWLAGHEFEFNPAEDPLCRGVLWMLNMCRGLSVLPLVWWGNYERGKRAEVSSSSLGKGIKLRVPSPIALV
ncbi:hypothetical protein TNCV_3493011 [Trichonephila clavipes]|nr:hypothetical protein TNCV_3493011 [Trichonephila clavipes]